MRHGTGGPDHTLLRPSLSSSLLSSTRWHQLGILRGLSISIIVMPLSMCVCMHVTACVFMHLCVYVHVCMYVCVTVYAYVCA